MKYYEARNLYVGKNNAFCAQDIFCIIFIDNFTHCLHNNFFLLFNSQKHPVQAHVSVQTRMSVWWKERRTIPCVMMDSLAASVVLRWAIVCQTPRPQTPRPQTPRPLMLQVIATSFLVEVTIATNIVFCIFSLSLLVKIMLFSHQILHNQYVFAAVFCLAWLSFFVKCDLRSFQGCLNYHNYPMFSDANK